MNEIQQRIESYVDMCKVQRGTVSASLHAEAVQALSEFLKDNQYWKKGIEFVLALPPRTGAEAFFAAWYRLSSEDRNSFLETWKGITNDKRATALSRQIYITQKVFSESKTAAWDLLIDLCTKMTDENTKIPNDKIIKMFNDNLSATMLFVYHLDAMDLTEQEFTSLLIVTLEGLMSKTNGGEWGSHEGTVSEYLKWLDTVGREVRISKGLRTHFEKSSMSWPVNYKERLLRLGALDCIVSKIEPAIEKQLAEQKMMNTSFKFDVWMDALKNHLLFLGSESEQHKLQVVKIQNEKDSEYRLRMKLEEKCAALDEKWRVLEAEKNLLSEELANEREKSRNLEQLLILKEQEYESGVAKLTDMTEQESQYVADQFKNKLSKSLRMEYADFREILDEPMSVELGENLRAQLTSIFELLKKQGVSL